MTVQLSQARADWERLARRSVINEATGCWLWMGARGPNGYGYIRAAAPERRMRLVHRLAWRVSGEDEPPDDMQLDHACHSADESCEGGPTCLHRSCWNPAHLELVTPQENTARGRPPINDNNFWAKQTHCIHGHPFSVENTRWIGNMRQCRACDAQRKREQRQR